MLIILPEVQHSETNSGPALSRNLKRKPVSHPFSNRRMENDRICFQSSSQFSEMPLCHSIAALNNQAQFSSPLPPGNLPLRLLAFPKNALDDYC